MCENDQRGGDDRASAESHREPSKSLSAHCRCLPGERQKPECFVELRFRLYVGGCSQSIGGAAVQVDLKAIASGSTVVCGSIALWNRSFCWGCSRALLCQVWPRSLSEVLSLRLLRNPTLSGRNTAMPHLNSPRPDCPSWCRQPWAIPFLGRIALSPVSRAELKRRPRTPAVRL